jgi:hypothetical protein
MFDPRWRLPTRCQEVSGEHADDRGRRVAPQRPYRNLAVAAGAFFGIVCGCVLAAYLTLNVDPLKGWGWIIGFPVGVAGGSTLGYFVLLKLVDLLGKKR